ncbi:MAG: hypothetical protein KGK03_09495 [Candidatus Omnitrophica bacterium]|nr:hypothetical protein [Candidatus Omnitrophota bacterium]MDE2223286.1 hypothetical protein [Candidatus Omnitrophota bacterium]
MQETHTKENEISRAINEGERKLEGAASEAQKRLQEGRQKLEQMVKDADKQLRENPWPVVAGVAVACLFLGFFAGNYRK